MADDLHRCAALGVGFVFAPSVTEMYPDWPEPPATLVSVGAEAARWEGASRPGHFEGVATVVAKLFSLAGRCRAYFGEKDFQQLAVVRRMAADLGFPVEVVGCPTVRDPDGLALSSRNRGLSESGRALAAAFPRILREPAPAQRAAKALGDAGFGVDYVEDHAGVRLGAVRLEEIRLIDNVRL
jgi:pantoate--beta-alanine ligase